MKHIISNTRYFTEVQQMLNEGKDVRIRIKGKSMLPFIADGDRVLLKAYRGGSLSLGSSVLAKHEGEYVFHRYVGKKKNQLVLAGDGNLARCEHVHRNDIIATAICHYRLDASLPIDLDGTWPRVRGLCWYHIRLLRRIIAKLSR